MKCTITSVNFSSVGFSAEIFPLCAVKFLSDPFSDKNISVSVVNKFVSFEEKFICIHKRMIIFLKDMSTYRMYPC